MTDKSICCVETFELLQILPGAGWLAVHWDDGIDDFVGDPLDFIGLAKVTLSRYRAETNILVKKEDQGNELVGIVVVDGYEHICNEDRNFTGMCREGQPLWKAHGHLEGGAYPKAWELIRKRREEEEEPVPA